MTLAGAAPDRFPAPRLRVRGTGRTEMDLMPAVEALGQAILVRRTARRTRSRPPRPGLWTATTGCSGTSTEWGPSRDTVYLRTIPELRLGPNHFVLFTGPTTRQQEKPPTRTPAYTRATTSTATTCCWAWSASRAATFEEALGITWADAPDTLYAWKVRP